MSLSRSIFVKAGLGQILRELRKELGLTQEAFARKIDVSLNTIKRYDQAKFDPDPIILLRIIKIAPDHWKIRLVPHLPPEIVECGDAAMFRRQLPRAVSRYSVEIVDQAHDMLEAVMAEAPSAIVEELLAKLTAYAGKYVTGRERLRRAPSGVAKGRAKGV